MNHRSYCALTAVYSHARAIQYLKRSVGCDEWVEVIGDGERTTEIEVLRSWKEPLSHTQTKTNPCQDAHTANNGHLPTFVQLLNLWPNWVCDKINEATVTCQFEHGRTGS